ncbi:MAG: glycosyltransferase [Planctomycetaceae bacterium]|nr:MAG: glycosyltransferase [Planctomycetaceae bacterium]
MGKKASSRFDGPVVPGPPSFGDMRILFLHSGDRVPSARFRALPVARRLRQAGHRCTLASSFPQKYDYFPWLGFRPSQALKRIVRFAHLVLARLRRYDVVVLDRELFDNPTVAMEERFRKAVKRLILDVDDGIFLRYPEKFARLAQMADHVVAGNRFLADKARTYNECVSVIPTCIELDDYPQRSPDDGAQSPIIIGWIGTHANVPYLAIVAPALRRLAQRHRIELRIVASSADPLQDLDLQGVPFRFVPWQGEHEVREILQFHIGLMPLPADQQWTRYKCGLKLLQYMAVGLPAVASPVGVNAEIVQHGMNGYLATTVTEWEEALAALIVDPEKRLQLGTEARRTVKSRYSVEVNLARYLEVFQAPST